MERSSKAVRRHRGGSGDCRRSLEALLRKVFIVSLISFPVSFAQTTNFLIVQQPDHLVVYDSFQQSITSLQQSAIRPFTPMKILVQRTTLGDGLTPCMKVDIDGEEFYLLRDESGKLAGWKTLGEVKTFSNKKLLGDTIAILASRRTANLRASAMSGVLVSHQIMSAYGA